MGVLASAAMAASHERVRHSSWGFGLSFYEGARERGGREIEGERPLGMNSAWCLLGMNSGLSLFGMS